MAKIKVKLKSKEVVVFDGTNASEIIALDPARISIKNPGAKAADLVLSFNVPDALSDCPVGYVIEPGHPGDFCPVPPHIFWHYHEEDKKV